MIAFDTSLVVAAFCSWHEHHEIAKSRLVHQKVRLPAHVLIESYSTLTRMPPPFRAPPAVARQYLERQFPHTPLQLPGSAVQRLVLRSAVDQVVGGAVYDALVAATAAHARLALLTLDRRAARTYEAMEVEHEILA